VGTMKYGRLFAWACVILLGFPLPALAWLGVEPGEPVSNTLEASFTARSPLSRPGGASAPEPEVAPPPEPEAPPGFPDVRGHWAETEITAMFHLGIVEGYPDGTFKPDQHVTRAEFAKMLVLSMGLKAEPHISPGFTDEIPQWAKPFIMAAAKHGIMVGYPDGSARPSEPITRGEMAAMMARASGHEIGSPMLLRFHDEVPEWARPYVSVVQALGLMRGFPDGSFGTDRFATRAECCVVLWRFLNL